VERKAGFKVPVNRVGKRKVSLYRYPIDFGRALQLLTTLMIVGNGLDIEQETDMDNLGTNANFNTLTV
jgi:hypothetical protein